ncbi:MAG: DnaJ domain-containing protein [Flammeovirgaceae bacterium]
MENYYHILGLTATATDHEIKRAFKRLAVKYHPDKNPHDRRSAEEKFKRVNAAYQVLSNPSLKAQYDLRLMNRDYEINFRSSTSSTNKHRDPRYHRRQYSEQARGFARYSRARYSRSEDQKKGFAWAMGIMGSILVLFLIFYGVSAVLTYLRSKELEAKRTELKMRVKHEMTANEFRSLIAELQHEMDELDAYDREMDQFYQEVIQLMEEQAQERFKNKEYTEALAFFELWEELDPSEEIFLSTRMAEAYKHIGQYYKSQKYLYKMIKNKRSIVFAYAELGRIYAKHLNDINTALSYYDTASNYIIKEYTDEFGEAYGIMLDPKRLPELQYDVYVEKGEIHETLGEHEEAIIACNWASFIRMNKSKSYYIKGNAEYNLGNYVIACQDWAKAASLGNKKAKRKIKQFCK